MMAQNCLNLLTIGKLITTPLFRFVVTILFVVMLSACATTRIGSVAPAPEPVTMGKEGSASISFSRVIIRIPSGSEVGAHHDGLLKVPQYSYIWSSNILVGPDDFKIKASELLKSYGYNVLGGDNLLFGQDESAKAEYQLGATIISMAYNTYAPLAGNYSECNLLVEWQLYDVFKDQVVFKQISEGYGKQKNYGSACFQDAFAYSLKNMLAKSTFSENVKRSPRQEWVSNTELLKKIKVNNFLLEDNLVLPKDIEKVMDATIIIRSGNSIGSGVLVSNDGWALTAAHVVSGITETQVTLHSGIQISARVERIDKQQDIALIKLNGSGFKYLKIGNSDDNKIGSEIYAIGAPTGTDLAFSITKGIISGYRDIEGRKYIQTDAALNPGNSGGPMISANGHLIGIVSWKISSVAYEGLAFGVPPDAAADKLGIMWE